MRHGRGNLQEEVTTIERSIRTECECRNTGVRRLQKAFEDIGDYPKPIPTLGRPRESAEVKRNRRDEKALERTGQLRFSFR